MWACCVYIYMWCHRMCIATYSPKEAVSTWSSLWYRFNRGIILLQKLHRLIATTNMIEVEWKLTTVLHQELWLATPPCTHGSPGSMLCAEQQATHSCMVAQLTTAPDTKPWSIPTTSHYLNQGWLRSLTPNTITKPLWWMINLCLILMNI